MRRRPGWLALVAAVAAAPACAGPPFDTDDPVPTEPHHWELYAFAAGAEAGGAFDGATGLDANYGAAPGLQLTTTLPVEFTTARDARGGFGDVELGAKYRFVKAGGFSLAAFPRLILPTSGARGSGRTGVLLPLWAEQDAGPWSVFGGGGYRINPGPGNRDYWLAALAVTRAVTERLLIGGEVTHGGADTIIAAPVTTLGIGGIWRIGGPFSLLASAGPSFAGRDGDRYHVYAALGLAF